MEKTLDIPKSIFGNRKFPYRGNASFRKNVLPYISSEVSSPIVEWSLFHELRAQGYDLDIARDNKSVYHPDEMFLAFEKYTHRSNFKWTSYIQDAFNIALKTFGVVGTDYLNPLEDHEVDSAIKENKSSGAPSFTSKGKALKDDYNRFINISLNLRAPDPCVAFHRVQHGEEGPKNRMVWGYPQSMTLLESKYAKPLIEKFKRSNTPMCVGLHRIAINARALGIRRSGIRYGIDFSAFDSSIPPKLIQMAFSILQTHFKLSDDDQDWKNFDKIIHYFIHTPIIMPDGYVYVKHSGIPSGSYFTQLIGSIVNFIIIQAIMMELSESGRKKVQNDKILVLGDDSLFGFDEYINLEAIKSVARKYGLTVNVLKSEMTKTGEPIYFLGHSWQHGAVDRPLLDIAKRIAFPEKHSRSKLRPQDRQRQRVEAYLTDAESAIKIYAKWSHYNGPNGAGQLNTSRRDVPVTGWEIYLDSVEEFDTYNASWIRNYTGILF